jgi:hypothetical protein
MCQLFGKTVHTVFLTVRIDGKAVYVNDLAGRTA